MNGLKKTLRNARLEAYAIYGLLALVLVLLLVMYLRLDSSIKKTAENLLEDKSSLVEQKLDNFFSPFHQKLNEEWIKGQTGIFDKQNISDFLNHFVPILKSNPAIYAAYVSDIDGNHKFVRKAKTGEHKTDSLWMTSQTFFGNETDKQQEIGLWFYSSDTTVNDSLWTPEELYDPRERPWFQAAINSDTSICTSPYWFSGNRTLGISISQKFQNPEGVANTVSMDITLQSLSELTSEMTIGGSGKAFILTDSADFLALPKFEGPNAEDSLVTYRFSNISDFQQDEVSTAYDEWKTLKDNTLAYSFTANSETYWAKFSEYRIGNATFYLGVVALENDIIGSIQQTRLLILLGMIFIVIFAIVLVQAYRSKNKSNILLAEQKLHIEEQNKLVVEKNQEIIDSITYAKRIQSAIMPPDDFVKEYLPKSFIFYRPKDIVAGDFYWLNVTENRVLFAAADCTGHGVPGALVSVVCNNSLNRSVNEFEKVIPGDVLNSTRKLVIEEFKKSEEEVKDGMDIALCSLEGNVLKYAGAHNPLWIIRKEGTEVEEYKANKQPIGNFENMEPYTTHSIEVQPGDRVYLFSDGYVDQFGGEKGKKFKSSNFKKLLISFQNMSMEEQKNRIVEVFDRWKGEFEQLDDVCVMGVEIT